MASTTPKLGLNLPADGEPGWGAMYRTNFTALDQAAGGQNCVKTLAGGTYTLSNTEAMCDSFEFNGALTSNLTVIVPNNMPPFAVENLTSGNFTLTIKTATGAGVVIDQKAREILYCNGTNCESLTYPTIVQIVSNATTAVGAAATTVALGAQMALVGANTNAVANTVTINEAGIYRIKGAVNGVTTAAVQTLALQVAKNGVALSPKGSADQPTAVAGAISAMSEAVTALVVGDLITLQATGSVANGVTLNAASGCWLIVEKL